MRVDHFESAVFLFSSTRVKRELFEIADVTASILSNQGMHSNLWGSREGILFICFRADGTFSKTFLAWTRIFFIRINKDAFSKISGYGCTGPRVGHLCFCGPIA